MHTESVAEEDLSRAGARAMGQVQSRRGLAHPARGLATLNRVCLVPKSEGTPDPCDDYMSTFSGLESLNLSGSPMVRVTPHPDSPAPSPALLPGPCPFSLASLSSEEWNGAPQKGVLWGRPPSRWSWEGTGLRQPFSLPGSAGGAEEGLPLSCQPFPQYLLQSD